MARAGTGRDSHVRDLEFEGQIERVQYAKGSNFNEGSLGSSLAPHSALPTTTRNNPFLSTEPVASPEHLWVWTPPKDTGFYRKGRGQCHDQACMFRDSYRL